MSVTIPHLSVPFRVFGASVAQVEQNSIEDDAGQTWERMGARIGF